MLMSNDNEDTSIRISKKLRNKVADLGSKDDSFETIIERLHDFYKRYERVVKVSR